MAEKLFWVSVSAFVGSLMALLLGLVWGAPGYISQLSVSVVIVSGPAILWSLILSERPR